MKHGGWKIGTDTLVTTIVVAALAMITMKTFTTTTTTGTTSFSMLPLCHAKEVEVTKEWKLLGENDTIPAGMHVRMDLTTGEKWVKQIDENDDDDDDNGDGGGQKKDGYTNNNAAAAAAVIIDPDGTATATTIQEVTKATTLAVTKSHEEEERNENAGYDYEMMHRTLSKLPDKEKERFGGLPELPQAVDSSSKRHTLTSEERKAFERRMEEIWQQRQELLQEMQEHLLDVPEVLKERIKLIRQYLQDPITHLNNHVPTLTDDDGGYYDADDSSSSGVVTHIISVLQDLEFQLSDIDMARDFHMLGGWPLLVSLVSEEANVPANKTMTKLSRNTVAKIRAVQANAAWAIGTLVKNTDEFYPYAIEPLILNLNVIDSSSSSSSSSTTTTKNKKMMTVPTRTTAIDLLVDVFCKKYNDNGKNNKKKRQQNDREVRTLLTKSIYAIGALLRGNRIAQIHISKESSNEGGGANPTSSAPVRLGEKLRDLAHELDSSSNNMKLVQRLLSLASDIVADVTFRNNNNNVKGNDEEETMNNSLIISSFTSSDWCYGTSEVLTVGNTNLPVPVQETVLQSILTVSSHCHQYWDEQHRTSMVQSLSDIESEWKTNKNDFDVEHYQQLLDQIVLVKKKMNLV